MKKAYAMILESHASNLYAMMHYVRFLDADASEPHDGCVGGDVQAYLNRFHDGAQLVDAPTFMGEWMLRRAWKALQAVPSYVEKQARLFASEVLS